MADYTFLPPAGSEQTGAYPTVLGQPSVDGPIVYPEQQPDTNPNVVPFTRETGLDPNKIPSLNEILNQKPVLKVVEGGKSVSVASTASEPTGAVEKGALVVAAQGEQMIEDPSPSRRRPPMMPPLPAGPAAAAGDQKGKISMPWWGVALLAGAAVAVGYSFAKRGSDEPLVADMDDEEAED